MFLNSIPKFEDVRNSFNIASTRFGSSIGDENDLFDNFVAMETFIKAHKQDLNNLSVEEKWKFIFKNTDEQNLNINTMKKLVEFAYVLPGTSAEVEREFSLINNIWRDERESLKLETVNSIVSIQYNSKKSCSEFYKHIKSNTELLKKS